MAESVVSFLIEKLANLAEEEIRLLTGVAQEINDIKDELQSIKVLLRNADSKADIDEGVKEWVKQVRGVAYEIEDALEEYFLSCHHVGKTGAGGCINHILGKIRSFFQFLKLQHEIGNQIIDIKQRIQEISSRKERYHLSNLNVASSSTAITISKHDPREDALFLEEAHLVGTDEPREKLTGYIFEANNNLSVLSVHGEGGLGKTTIVKKVFDSHQVKKQFLYRAWLTVSQTPDIKSLLIDLHKHLFPKMHVEDSIINLKQQLNDNLRGKRYVVVLDDVWTISDWKQFKNALPDDNESASRILVTTRKQEVAVTCIQDCGHIYPLERLNSDQSWKLFYMKTCNSRVEDMNCYPEGFLRDQSEKFLRKCNGLPLAIVAIGGLLSMKRLSEWDRVYQTHGYLFTLGDLDMVISLSFNDLPYHLKSCFLYLSMFPEDYTINCSRLVRLWVAQGFVETRQRIDVTMEEIARSYLDELIQRSLIQAEHIDECKKVVTCKIHDLMRDFIIGKARDQNFAEIIAQKHIGRLQQSRHLSICTLESDGDAKSNILFNNKKRLVAHFRSLFIFSSTSCSTMTSMLLSFRLVKVLDLEDVNLKEFPGEVVNLLYLRYLSLRRNHLIDSLPNSVENLVHLETLDVRETEIQKLPETILKLRHLCNLLMQSTMIGVRLPIGIDCLVALEKLAVVEATESLAKELGMLRRLRSLDVYHLTEDNGKHLFASIERMEYLLSLKVRVGFQEGEVIDSHSLKSPPPCLQRLFMIGSLRTLPDWFSLLKKLEKLSLVWSKLIDDPFPVLQKLPNLVTLKLGSGAFVGKELHISKPGFPRLNKLILEELTSLNSVELEQGSMPAIQSIDFWDCRKLQNIPHGVYHLDTLQIITYGAMPHNFVVQLKDQHPRNFVVQLRDRQIPLRKNKPPPITSPFP